MPKRPLDITSPVPMSAERAQRKTERSHEENQERAYIAASRRADRSIEARVQSARMASEIHKRRTGKAFKISEEVVMREEMYEEEDDDLPRHYRALAAHLQTSNADMNDRLNAYLTNQVAMASLARQQEVNRMFAEEFPNASQVSQQIAKSMYLQPLQQQQQHQQQQQQQQQGQVQGQPSQSPTSPTSQGSPLFRPVNYNAPSGQVQRDRTASFAQSVDMFRSPRLSTNDMNTSPLSCHESIDGTLSPPMLTPGSTDTPTPQSFQSLQGHPQQQQQQQPATTTTTTTTTTGPNTTGTTQVPAEPSLSTMPSAPTTSSFTTELAPEAKQMVNLDLSDPLAYSFFGGGMTGAGQFGYFNFPPTPATGQRQPGVLVKEDDQHRPDGFLDGSLYPASRFLDIGGQASNIGTPGGGAGDLWDAWVNTDQWSQLEADEQH